VRRVALALALALAPGVAEAYPACASGQRGFSGLHLVLLLLPLVVAFFAGRAILRALDE